MKKRALLALALFASCSSYAKYSGFPGSEDKAGNNDSVSAGPPAQSDSEEREVESTFQAPVATGRFLWVANPTSGRVAYIDAETLAVATVAAGHAPTHLAAIGNEDTTIVINVGSNDATLLRLSDGGIQTKTYPLAAGMNQWSNSDDGRYAIAWTDARKLPLAPKTDGFQEITFLDLQTGTSSVLSVGYRPTQISFNVDRTRAFAVTSDGISVISLDDPTGPRLIRNVRLADDIETASKVADVGINPLGSHAIARIIGTEDIVLSRLADGVRTVLSLSAIVTDLDLRPDGASAVAVLRDNSSIAIIPVGDAPTPEIVALVSQNMGSISLAADASVGVLYTNASDTEEVSVLSLSAPPATRPIRVYAPVLGAFATRNGEYAVVVHEPDSGGAFSLLPLAEELPAKIVSTIALPSFVATSNDSSRALVVSYDPLSQTQAAYLARMPAFSTQTIGLSSRPLAAGIVEGARRAFVSQTHPAGRVTFIHLDTGETRTLTGFELSARIVEGAKP